MIRKSLFWGLTLVLFAALIVLVVRGRRLEKQEARKVVEVVQESEPSPIRVLAPRDLEISQSKMLLQNVSDGSSKSQTARHQLELRNKGAAAYGSIQLSFEYLDRGGKQLAVRNSFVEEAPSPGTALRLADIRIEGLPLAAADCRTTIVYAELKSAPKMSTVRR